MSFISQETEGIRHRNKKPAILPRSDSIGSASGRKYLAPTLSDPSSCRNEKEKITVSKKRSSRPPRKFFFILHKKISMGQKRAKS